MAEDEKLEPWGESTFIGVAWHLHPASGDFPQQGIYHMETAAVQKGVSDGPIPIDRPT